MGPSPLDQLKASVLALFPAGENINEEVRKRLDQILQKGFDEFNIVTREQFQFQIDALNRAEQRIEQLELELESLQKKLG